MQPFSPLVFWAGIRCPENRLQKDGIFILTSLREDLVEGGATCLRLVSVKGNQRNLLVGEKWRVPGPSELWFSFELPKPRKVWSKADPAEIHWLLLDTILHFC